MNRKRMIVSVCLTISALAPRAWALDANGPTWSARETLPGAGSFLYSVGADRALACDHFGTIAVAYCDPNARALRYAERVPGAGWVACSVETTGLGYTGVYPSLAFDRYERPAISYYDNNLMDLRFARYDGSAWQKTTVDSAGNVGLDSCLAFDVYGRPAIAYADGNNLVKLAYDDGDGNFTVTFVGSGRKPTLAFDGLNRPRVVYRQMDNSLAIATRWTGGWTNYSPGYSVSGAPTLAIDPATGNPALAFVQATTLDLIYLSWDGHAWVSTVADTSGSLDSPSLAFDPADGRPAIAYSDGNSLQFAWFDGTAWRNQVLDETAGSVPSLAFNEYAEGWPAIAYMDSATTGRMYFIEDPPGVPEPASAAPILLGAAALARRRRR